MEPLLEGGFRSLTRTQRCWVFQVPPESLRASRASFWCPGGDVCGYFLAGRWHVWASRATRSLCAAGSVVGLSKAFEVRRDPAAQDWADQAFSFVCAPHGARSTLCRQNGLAMAKVECPPGTQRANHEAKRPPTSAPQPYEQATQPPTHSLGQDGSAYRPVARLRCRLRRNE